MYIYFHYFVYSLWDGKAPGEGISDDTKCVSASSEETGEVDLESSNIGSFLDLTAQCID